MVIPIESPLLLLSFLCNEGNGCHHNKLLFNPEKLTAKGENVWNIHSAPSHSYIWLCGDVALAAFSPSGLVPQASTVTTSGHYCLQTNHGVLHSHLSYTRASYSSVATPEGMLITFLSRAKLTNFHWDSVVTFNPTLIADEKEGVSERGEGKRREEQRVKIETNQ